MTILYSERRKELKTGDLVIWDTTTMNSFFDFVLYLYQKILGARYIHVGIVVTFGNRIFVLEATPPVVRLHPLSLMEDFYHLPIGQKVLPKQLNSLFSRLGKAYGLMDLIRMILKIRDNPYQYFCSELASDFYNEIGLIRDRTAGKTPDKIIEAIEQVTGNKPVLIHIDKGNLNVV